MVVLSRHAGKGKNAAVIGQRRLQAAPRSPIGCRLRPIYQVPARGPAAKLNEGSEQSAATASSPPRPH